MSDEIKGIYTAEDGTWEAKYIAVDADGKLLIVGDTGSGGSGGSSGGLTDDELRASPVVVDTELLQPLTNDQLRASSLSVTFSSQPLPTGASTESSLLLVAKESTLTSIGAKIPDLLNNKVAVEPLGQPSVARKIDMSSASSSQALTVSCTRVSIFAEVSGFYKIGASASSSDHYISAGERLDLSVPSGSTLSAVSNGDDGPLYITELI